MVRISSFLHFFAVAAALCPLAAFAQYQGVSLVNVTDVEPALRDESMQDLRQIGANTVAIDVHWPASGDTGAPDTTLIGSRLDMVLPVVESAQENGLDVFLRSNVDFDSSRISADFNRDWINNYRLILNGVADFANENDVALVSIGSNLHAMENTDVLGSMVRNVRERYRGDVTYSANFLPSESLGGGFREVSWWDELDFVGVNAFPPLTFDFNAIPEELNAGAEGLADELQSWLTTNQPNKKLIFTSTGYRSVDGGSVFPLDRAGDRVDLEEQADAYSAVLSTFTSREWWGGSFWTGWDADPRAGGPGDNGFTPQNKPAEAVLAESFGGKATFTIRPSLLESWEQGLNGWSLPNSGSSGGLSVQSMSGITDGQQSLALRTGNGTTAAKLWTLDGSEAYTLLQEALADPSNYRLQLDVSLEDEAAATSTLRISLMDDSEVPNVVSAPVNFAGGTDGARDTVEVPLSQFGELNSAAIFYELHLSSSDTSNDRILIDNLRLVTTIEGDVTNDTVVDCDDIDAVSAAVRLGWTDSQFDVNADGIINNADRTEWMSRTGTLEGDFDLNGKVEFADFLVLSDNFSQPGNWCAGDATGDREVNFADFLMLSTNFGTAIAADTHSVPEPQFSLWPVLVLLMLRKPFGRFGSVSGLSKN